jgi:flagellar protein FlaG
MIVPPRSLEPTAAFAPRTSASGRALEPARSPVAASAESSEAVREAVAALNRAATALNNNVQLSVDSDSGRTIVRVVDTETGQLIRQIPSEEALELRNALERIAGLLIDRTA